MPAVPKERLRKLTTAEEAALQRISQASSERVDHLRRARAVLAVTQGASFARAAHTAGLCSGTAVANLVARFNRRGLAALRIAPGRGRKPTYDPAARAQIVATAQQTPDRKADGTATWSLSTLQRRLRQDGLPALGATTIRRVLADAGNSYQRRRTWCPTGTAQRKRKSGVVTVVDPQTEARNS
jgi:transposase